MRPEAPLGLQGEPAGLSVAFRYHYSPTSYPSRHTRPCALLAHLGHLPAEHLLESQPPLACWSPLSKVSPSDPGSGAENIPKGESAFIASL